MTIRALVVDDDQGIRQMLELALEFEDFSVLTAGDGPKAIATARAVRPDVILLDVMMPGMSGLEVAQTLRTDPVTSHIPIVILTAKAGEEDVWSGWQAGIDSYLTKPIDLDLMLSEIFRVLAFQQAGV